MITGYVHENSLLTRFEPHIQRSMLCDREPNIQNMESILTCMHQRMVYHGIKSIIESEGECPTLLWCLKQLLYEVIQG